jgi:transcriptional regulator with XRE-family HTH domain
VVGKEYRYRVDGQKLRDARLSRGWTQEDLSQQTEMRANTKQGERAISVRTIRRAEAGGCQHGYTIRRLADALVPFPVT